MPLPQSLSFLGGTDQEKRKLWERSYFLIFSISRIENYCFISFPGGIDERGFPRNNSRASCHGHLPPETDQRDSPRDRTPVSVHYAVIFAIPTGILYHIYIKYVFR